MEKQTCKILDDDGIDLYNELPIRFYIIENFSESSSYIGLLFSHAWMDGISFTAKLYLLRRIKSRNCDSFLNFR